MVHSGSNRQNEAAQGSSEYPHFCGTPEGFGEYPGGDSVLREVRAPMAGTLVRALRETAGSLCDQAESAARHPEVRCVFRGATLLPLYSRHQIDADRVVNLQITHFGFADDDK